MMTQKSENKNGMKKRSEASVATSKVNIVEYFPESKSNFAFLPVKGTATSGFEDSSAKKGAAFGTSLYLLSPLISCSTMFRI